MAALSLTTVNRVALTTAAWTVVLIGFSLPISTAMDSILQAMALIAFLLAGHYRERLRLLRFNPAVIALVGLFVLIACATLYGEGSAVVRAKYLSKYSDLLLVILMVPLFAYESTRRRALIAFGAAMSVTLVLSLLFASGLLAPIEGLKMKPGNAVVFRMQITHNLLMAFAAFLFATAALSEGVRWKRGSLYLLAFLASLDVLFFVRGRTGQLVLLALTVYFFARHFGWRGFFAGVLTALVAVAAAWYLSSVFRERVILAATEYEQSTVESAADSDSSVGLRMEWYRNTLRMIAQRPVFGVGTGGFPEAYAAFVTDPAAQKPAHPHNQYLMTAAEMGLVGLCTLLAVFIWLWKSAVRIPDLLQRDLVRGLIITFVIGCLFNSLLIDHTEGLFFVWMLALAFAGVDAGGERKSG